MSSDVRQEMTPALFNVLICISAIVGISSIASFILRRRALGLALGGSFLSSLALGYVAATQTDPPSLLPLWGWLFGSLLGAFPGFAVFSHVRRTKRVMLSDRDDRP